MFENISDLKKFLRGLNKSNILFSPHFHEKSEIDRAYLTEELIQNSFKDIKNIIGFQKQRINNEKRYRVGIRLSNKYNLIIVCKLSRKGLYIITAWKSDRKWEKAIQK